MPKFYDTNALLKLQEKVFDEPFVISSITLLELDNIKESKTKDGHIKYLARKVSERLKQNVDSSDFTVVVYSPSFLPVGLDDTPDARICSCAMYYRDNVGDVDFVTYDTNCYLIAKTVFGLNAVMLETECDDYTGFIELALGDNDLAEFYQHPEINICGALKNQYVVINNGVDVRRWDGEEFIALKDKMPKTNQFGVVKAKDVYQRMAIDSMNQNQITMVKGAAGTGKTYLALSALFAMLEKHDIDKIIVFCNPVATAYSARLGFYPGSKDEKLMDSTIGNILISKIGDINGVEYLISTNKLELLALADLRGFDTSGMKAGILIEEAENLDISLMKLALQRIGADSRCIIDGDYNAQVDMEQYAGDNNGMRRASKVFRGYSCYGEVELQKIYRSEIAEIANQM